MSYFLLLLLFRSSAVFFVETSSVIDSVKERLENSAIPLSVTTLDELPDSASYLNQHLINNIPHTLDLSKDLTRIIHEWTPRLLALDPTCPYYFTKLDGNSATKTDLNLFSYLQAVEHRIAIASPFISTLPQSYRNAIPLPSIFHCSEFIYPKSTPFFQNVELIVGPGQTELPLKRLSDGTSQLYCSLYGQPHLVLINQSKQSIITYDAKTLLSSDTNLADVEYVLTSLAPYSCLFIPSDWVLGAQLDNSISLVFTLNKIEKPTGDELLPCTNTGRATLETIEFSIVDTFNITDIGLVVYFYQYLNPPMFDKIFTRDTFLEEFKQDKNVSQLILNWTPMLTNLIRLNLFDQLDINHDEKFSSDDYFKIKQKKLPKLQNSILNVLEQIRQNVLAQYHELSESLSKMTESLHNTASNENIQETLKAFMENLPEQVVEELKERNPSVEKVLNQGKPKRPRRPSKGEGVHTRQTDTTALFDDEEGHEASTQIVEQDPVEEITAEPTNEVEIESHRTDL